MRTLVLIASAFVVLTQVTPAMAAKAKSMDQGAIINKCRAETTGFGAQKAQAVKACVRRNMGK